jgi:hypothetical protein
MGNSDEGDVMAKDFPLVNYGKLKCRLCPGKGFLINELWQTEVQEMSCQRISF